MYDFTQDTNHSLAEFVNDYIEDKLDEIEQTVFEEYLASDTELSAFINKSRVGKKALNNTFRIRAADNFEEKLAQRIADETESKPSRNSTDLASAC